jgi:hypothetical protein
MTGIPPCFSPRKSSEKIVPMKSTGDGATNVSALGARKRMWDLGMVKWAWVIGVQTWKNIG